MLIDYRQKGKVRFSMKKNIRNFLEEVPYDNGTAITQAVNHLFNEN